MFLSVLYFSVLLQIVWWDFSKGRAKCGGKWSETGKSIAKLNNGSNLRLHLFLMSGQVGGVDVEPTVSTSDMFVVRDQSSKPKSRKDNELASKQVP